MPDLRTDGRTERRMERRTDGWRDGRMERRTDRRTANPLIETHLNTNNKLKTNKKRQKFRKIIHFYPLHTCICKVNYSSFLHFRSRFVRLQQPYSRDVTLRARNYIKGRIQLAFVDRFVRLSVHCSSVRRSVRLSVLPSD